MSRAIPDDTLITLAEACLIVFAGNLKPESLKKEWRDGNLDLCKIGRSYFVSVADVRELKIKCRADPPARASGSTKNGERGQSSTAEAAAAQAAAEMKLQERKKSLGITSRQNAR